MSASRRRGRGARGFALSLVLTSVSFACASRPPGAAPAPAPAPPPSSASAERGPGLADLDGETRYPLDARGASANVLVFTTTDCPIANGYAPVVQGLVREHAGEPLRFFLVHVDPDVTPDVARAHGRAYGYELDGLAIVLDPEQRLARALEVSVTPESAVVGPAGALLYRGRIDDAWAELGRRRARARTRDLAGALAAVLAGVPVRTPRTAAVGCDLPLLLEPLPLER